jgi:DNA-binding MarR family transcriptional regulator
VLGLGLGFVMQVLVLAVQNAVEYRELGVATSGATLFRSMGGAIGVPIFGAIFANQLDGNLAAAFPGGVGAGDGSFQGSPAEIGKLPPAIHQPFITAYADSLGVVFLIAAVVALVAFALTWFLREVPLRQSISDMHIDEAFLANLFAAPRDENSLSELEQKLGLLAGRENRHWVYAALAGRAQADHTPQQLWLLFRLRDEGPEAAVPAMAARVGEDRERLQPEMRDLVERGLVHVAGVDLGEAGMTLSTTEAGDEILHAVDAARRENLEAMLADWEPELHPELLQLLERFSAELAKQAPV